MQNNEYNLSTHEFAKLCGTTRDTLRHYNEMGILVPHVNEANGYHYYAASQASSFYFINCFRKTGCTINEISDMIMNTSSEHVHSVLENQINNLSSEIAVLKKQVDSLSILLRILDYHEHDNVQNPGIYTIPKVFAFRTPVTNKKLAHCFTNIVEDVHIHVNNITTQTPMPAFPLGVTISMEDLLQQNYVYNEIITLTASKSANRNITALPSTKVVGCFHEDSSKDITVTYNSILEYINENKLTPLSDLFSISIFNIYDSDDKHTYLKCLFVCIE